jgi:hypothetical protein
MSTGNGKIFFKIFLSRVNLALQEAQLSLDNRGVSGRIKTVVGDSRRHYPGLLSPRACLREFWRTNLSFGLTLLSTILHLPRVRMSYEFGVSTPCLAKFVLVVPKTLRWLSWPELSCVLKIAVFATFLT